MNSIDNITGLVLCGGRSSRMGTDKGLIRREGITWAQASFSKLSASGISVYISVNNMQMNEYASLGMSAPLIEDDYPGVAGPLKGIMTLHSKFPEKDLLVISCDMPDVSESLLGRIIQEYLSSPGHDFYAYRTEGFLQSFPAIYTGAGLRAIDEKIRDKSLKSYSLQSIIRQGKYVTIQPEEHELHCFKNYNEVKDLDFDERESYAGTVEG